MPRIVPLRDLKNTTAISTLCHENDEPIFVTKNGYGDMVLMSMETYDALNLIDDDEKEVSIMRIFYAKRDYANLI